MSSNNVISLVAKKLNHDVIMGRKEDGFDPSPMKYPISGKNNVNYFSTSCKHRTAGNLSESLARQYRVPPPHITKGELVRLVSSASRLIDTTDVIYLAGRLAELPRVKNRQHNVCGMNDMFLPPIHFQGDIKKKSQCSQQVKGRRGETRKRSKPDLRPGTAVGPRVTAVTARKGREKTIGTGRRENEAREGEGSRGTRDTPTHRESRRICQERNTKKGQSQELSHTANSNDSDGEDEASILEGEEAAPVKAESRVLPSATVRLQSQNDEAVRPCLLRRCLALSGDTDHSSDHSDPESEQKDEESTLPGDDEEQTAESTVPTLETA